MHIYNVVRQKKDEHDYKLGAPEFEELPKMVDLREKCPPVFDQGNIGGCTANAGVAARMMLDGIQTELSRLFLYYKERELENSVNSDSGAQMRDVCKALNQFGTCEEQYWPYDIKMFAKKPPLKANCNAKKYTIGAYRTFDDDGIPDEYQFKQYLAKISQPILIGMDVYESFESDEVAKTGIVPMPNINTEKYFGGHAVLIVGYNDDKKNLTVRNSWGNLWGDKGYFYLPYEFVFDKKLAFDSWTLQNK